MIIDNKSAFDYKKAVDFLNRKEKAEKDRNYQLFLEARRDFENIIEVIKKYNPEKIYQWGSLLNPDQFDLNSDIDIAVEGIGSVDAFFKLFDEASNLTDFTLDLVEMEKISEVHQKSIRDQGTLIYERR